MPKIKNIQVINVRWFNATAWYALFLARLLQEQGHESLVLTLPQSPVAEMAKKWGIQCLELPLTSNNPLVILKLYFKIKKLSSSLSHRLSTVTVQSFSLFLRFCATDLKAFP